MKLKNKIALASVLSLGIAWSLRSLAHIIPFAFWQAPMNLFTWVGGPQTQVMAGQYGDLGVSSTANFPGEREDSCTWTDGSGNLWLFGGFGYDGNGNFSIMNDLWKYTQSDSKWTWISGSEIVYRQGVYGTKGTGSTSNVPGARTQAACVIDSTGNLWIFGGNGLDSAGNWGALNDLWKFNPSNLQWTWVAGSTTNDGSPTYGTKGTGATGNIPGARFTAASWVDSSDNIWIFGGYGKDNSGNYGQMNDLWEFTPSSLKWTYISGSKTNDSMPTYGTKGAGSTSNTPGARSDMRGHWVDSSGNLWLFGGNSADSVGSMGPINDLWKFTPGNKNWTWVGGANTIMAAPTYGTQGVGSTSNIPGARMSFEGVKDSSGVFWLFGGYGVDINSSQGTMGDLWKFDPSTSQWTWVSGSQTYYPPNVPGTKGVGSASNSPAGRSNVVMWADTSSNLWIFGGEGIDAANNEVFLNDLWSYTPSSGNWAWMAGSSTNFQAPVFGTKGVAAAQNSPGARRRAGTWLDSSGKLWLMGGEAVDAFGYVDLMNDLWCYDPATKLWTWVSGSSSRGTDGVYGTKGTGSTSNFPGGRTAFFHWADSSGNLWLFGGSGYDSAGNGGYLNDLWKYEIATGKWTWVAGSNVVGGAPAYGTKGAGSTSNIPGARDSGVSWTDSSGNFWLFAGYGRDNNSNYDLLNDLWKYNPTNGQWTWVTGAKTIDQFGTYGTKGTANASNTPGARADSIIWTDNNGVFWLFGGSGYDTNSNYGEMNDFWKFDPSTSQWTWMSGVTTINSNGVYGTKGTVAGTNAPGSRHSGAGWTDNVGNLYMFGGTGLDVNGTFDDLNDVWKYNRSSGQWTWMAGNSTVGGSGVYGTANVMSATNIPGVRSMSAYWSDGKGHAWIFGGVGRDGVGTIGYENDLWKIGSP